MIRTRTKKSGALKLGFAVVAAAALTFGGMTPALAAPGEEVEMFSTIPEVHPESSPSLSFHTWGIYEYGGLAVLDGTMRDLNRVEVGFVSWACEDGKPNNPDDRCATTPGAGFFHPITVNLYEEGEGGAIGELLGTVTQSTFVPYRPSSNIEECPSTNNGIGFLRTDTGECAHGFYFVASFDFSVLDLTLPDRVIVSSTYDSSNGGYNPMGPIPEGEEDGFNVLNMAIEGLSPARVGASENTVFAAGSSSYYPDSFGNPIQWGELYVPHISLITVEPGEEGAEDEPPAGEEGTAEVIQPKKPARVETGA